MNTTAPFLFSVDLEDVRAWAKDGFNYQDRLVTNVQLYLNLLNELQHKCTFFVVGDIIQRYPDLVQKIADEGHEIACHTLDHTPLDQTNKERFAQELDVYLEALKQLGIEGITGFRAPVFSLTERTQWVYDVLLEYGFKYSSSVLPAKNPLYGWAGFDTSPVQIKEGLWEIPVSLSHSQILNIPFGSGVYFRVLPMLLIKKYFRQCQNQSKPTIGYFHPYDVNVLQEKFMHPGINNNWFYNQLMYYNRGKVIDRLHYFFNHYPVQRYDTFVQNNLS